MKEMSVQPSLDLNVFLRVLPAVDGPAKNSFLTISDQGDALTITNPKSRTGELKDTFNFERVFSTECSQDDIYGEIESGITDYLFKGNSVGVFSLGQEGSGKTYTIFGEKNLSSEMGGANIHDKGDKRGIMCRACKTILEKMSRIKEKNIELKVQFYQVRQISIHDLIKSGPTEGFKSII